LQRGLYGPETDGQQHAEVDAPGLEILDQTVPTTAGQTYLLRFAHSPRPDVPFAQSLNVYWNGAVVATVTDAPTGPSAHWTYYSFTLTATSTTSRLGFGASTDSPSGASNHLDNVTLSPAGSCLCTQTATAP
jgi:hypothetical protein